MFKIQSLAIISSFFAPRFISGVLALSLSTLVPAQAFAELKVAFVFDKGGKDDKSFNSSAYRGAMEAKDKLKASIKYVEATDETAYESLLKSFAKKDYDLIIGIGVAQADAIRKAAAQFPQKHFVIVDGEVKAPNVRSLLFEEQEGSYLVGAIAALSSKTGKVGFIGGMDIPLIRRFEMGYAAGAKKMNPKVQVISNYIGVTGDAWNNPPKGKELALSQYSSGVDVIFSAAGASGSGVFDAAEEQKKFTIGVDSNQNWIKPGHVLTSMLKKIDEAVFVTCKEASEGRFSAGVQRFGLASKGIDYAVDQYNEKLLSSETRKKVEALKADIISGKVKVPDYYKK